MLFEKAGGRNSMWKPCLRGYLFGFNGKEKIDEAYGEANVYDFGERLYDPRIGRWFSVDRLEEKYPSLSPYAFVNNNPIINREVDGKDFVVTITPNADGKGGTITISTTVYTTSQSYDRAFAAAGLIEQQANGKFVYNWIDEKGVSQQYDIVFDISVQKIAPQDEATNKGSAYLAHMQTVKAENYDNTFDVVDDSKSGFMTSFFRLDQPIDDENGHTGAGTIDNKYAGARKSSEGKTYPNPSKGSPIARDLIGDAHEMLSHFFSGGMKKGMSSDGHTSGIGDITNSNLKFSGSNVSKATIVNIMQIVGAAQGNFEYKMGSNTQDIPKAKINGNVPTSFNKGNVDQK